jgi:hypothetical protein
MGMGLGIDSASAPTYYTGASVTSSTVQGFNTQKTQIGYHYLVPLEYGSSTPAAIATLYLDLTINN